MVSQVPKRRVSHVSPGRRTYGTKRIEDRFAYRRESRDGEAAIGLKEAAFRELKPRQRNAILRAIVDGTYGFMSEKDPAVDVV